VDEDPFFMFIGTTGPHDPYSVPQKFIDMYDGMEVELPDNFYDDMKDKPALYRRTKEQFSLTEEEHKESIRRYLAFCSFEDSLFGQVLDAVEKKGIQDDTVIMYLTDHGDYMGAHGLWAKGLPCFNEAYRICAAVHVPGMDTPRTETALVSIADFTPTILELTGMQDGLSCSGKSLVPLLHGKKPSDWRTEIYTQTNGNEIYGIQRAVWNEHWKYVFNTFDYDELYDLDNDPGEMTNLIERVEYKPIVKDLCRKMWSFARDTHDACTCPYIMVSLAPYGPGILQN
jgi:choline-sulfatase